MGAWRVCASMLGPVRWVSASTWKRARHERESKMEGERELVTGLLGALS